MAPSREPSSAAGRLIERLAAASPPVGDLLDRAATGETALDDYRPLARSLEWRLAERFWIDGGVTAFITTAVPYHVNNDGLASAGAAAVFLASCLDAPPGAGAIHALELGAGSGLFARFFLDELRALSQRGGHDVYDRLTLHVTDRSPATVGHWRTCGLFADHAGHVETSICDAESPDVATTVTFRAVLANYVLDSLPVTILRRDGDGWSELQARGVIRNDAAIPPALAGHGIEGLRRLAASNRPEDLTALLPLLPMLESEMAFRPIEPPAAGIEPCDEPRPAGATLVCNDGALRCLTALLPRLDPGGFVLVRDYGPAISDGAVTSGATQRFGGSMAVPLNFPWIEREMRRQGVDVLASGDDAPIHTRLLTRAAIPRARKAFDAAFGAAAAADALERTAHARRLQEQGLRREALAAYRDAIARAPRDWRLIGAAAELALHELRDPGTGLALTVAALRLNPWYCPALWNVLGDCLTALDRHDEAREAHAEALRLDPGSAETHLKLAASWLRTDQAAHCLDAVAKGLAADDQAMHRHALLEVQQQAVDQLSQKAALARDVAYRRRLRQSPVYLALPPTDGMPTD